MKRIAAACALFLACCSAHAYLVDWLTMSNYVAGALSGYSPSNSVSGLSPTSTNYPAVYWTNNIGGSYFSTNFNCTLVQVGVPGVAQSAAMVTISNTSASQITVTLPGAAYSLSSAQNVTAANVPAGTALALGFYYSPGGTIYVIDNGENNQALLSLAAAVAAANGLLVGNAGIVSSTVTPSITSVAASQAVYASYYNNFPGTTMGIQFQAYDSLGNVWLQLFNRVGVNGASISNATLDVVDLAQAGSSGAQGNDRFEHRSPYLAFSANTTGERQFIEGTTISDAFGQNASLIGTTLYTPSIITSNLTSSGGFITNGTLVFCTTTNIGPLSASLNYFALIPPGGWIYVSTNQNSGTVWVKR